MQSYRDKDGFYVLVRKKPVDSAKPFSTYKFSRYGGSKIGKRRLVTVDLDRDFCSGANLGDDIGYRLADGVGSWSNKAWNMFLRTPIKEPSVAGFLKSGDWKLRHAVRVLFCYNMSISENGEALRSVYRYPDDGASRYMLIDSLDQLERSLTSITLNSYRERMNLNHHRYNNKTAYWELKTHSRCIIAYDDGSYDVMEGDIYKMLGWFGIERGVDLSKPIHLSRDYNNTKKGRK